MTLLDFTHQYLFKFYNGLLSSAFDYFFTPVKSIHTYNTRSAANQSYYIPRARANHCLYNIRFYRPKYEIQFEKLSSPVLKHSKKNWKGNLQILNNSYQFS